VYLKAVNNYVKSIYKNLLIFIALVLFGGNVLAQNSMVHTEAEQHFSRAVDLLLDKQYGAARESFNAFSESYPESLRKAEARFYSLYCALFLENSGTDKQIENFTNEYPDHPLAKGAYVQLGHFYFEKEDYEKAIKYYTGADFYVLPPDEMAAANFKLGISYYQTRQLNQALTFFDRVKGGGSDWATDAYYYAAVVAFQNGNYFRATADFQQAAKSDKYKNQVPYYLANIYLKEEKYELLASYTAEVLDMPRLSNRIDLLLLSAEAQYHLKNYAQAASQYEAYATALKARPADDIRFKLGHSYFLLGQKEKAIDQLKTLGSSNDLKGQMAAYYLGHLYVEQGNFPFAVTSFERASKMNFSTETAEYAAYNFAKVCFEIGRFRDAIAVLEDFPKKFPGSRLLADANELIIEALLNTNDYAKAIEYIESLPNKSESIRRVYQKVTFYRGSEYFNDQRFPLAVQLFKKSLENPLDKEMVAQAHFWAGEAFSNGNRLSDAIPEYQAALRTAPPAALRLKINYGLGYAYYNSKDYSNALLQFRSYTDALENAADKQFYNDALLRLADCYFVQKDYMRSLNAYDKAIKQNNPEIDYVYFQRGLVYSFMENPVQAKESFDQVIRRYPNSRYHDNAILQYAQVDLERGNYPDAIKSYSLLIDRKPNSILLPFALLNRAISNVNLGNYAAAESDYKTILDKFISHRSAGSAILGLQEVSSQTGNRDFERYLTRYRNANPDKQALESIEFESAKTLYFNLDYARSITAFQTFLRTYPQSAFLNDARFYLAESYFRNNQNKQALELHTILANTPGFNQQNRSVNRVAELEFELKNFQRSIDFYKKLLEVAQNRRDEFTALQGLMLSYFQTKDYDNTKLYSRRILEQGSVSINAQSQANLFLGKASMEQGRLTEAKDHFLNTVGSAKDENGAEAQYLLALIQFREKDYRKSIETLFELNNHFGSYEEWLGKSFLLLADNYMALKEWMQARATLTSVQENSPLREIRDDARKKLAEVERLENENK
jgi:TolA-binding protein